MPRFRRRALTLAAPALLATGAARAQAWPGRPVRIVVGFAPGGANDIMARLLAQRLSDHIPGASFVVENRPGAGTLVGAEHVARAQPDGHTLLYTSTSTVITALTSRAATLDVPRDLLPVAIAQDSALLLISRPDFPARTLPQVLALAREKRGALTVGHPGTGGINHLSLALLRQQTGVEFTLVPYTGNQPNVNALVRGDVDLASDSLFATRSLLQAGTIRAIAISSAQRSATYPDVPTFAETLPGYQVTFWGGLLAPRGTPEPVLERLNQASNAVLREAEVQERIRGFGADPMMGSRAAFGAIIERDWQRWGQVVRETGMRAD